MVSSRAASERDGATAPMAGLGPMTGLADVGGPITDRGKIPGAQSEKVVQEFTGVASWYGPGFHGRRTANGEKFNQNELTAAHKTLPFNTRVRVTSVSNGRSVIVTINDRGPYVRGRMIDLSAAAAKAIGLGGRGVGKVKLEVLELPATTDHFAGSRSTDSREGPQAPRRVTTIVDAE
ncbi:septal ring lytic transglycosylase RlpA family protein [Zavarzinia aquatilis]|nr:septal ring lytic transglycosylase RlpA family protein [Zavarzinia aquatilis]